MERETMEDKKICPKCGRRTMVEKKLVSGRYDLVCTSCGEKRGPMKKDSKKGVV